MTRESTTHPVGRLAMRFFRDRRLILLTVLLAVASGVSSLAVLPRMEDPLMTGRAANIITIFPGAEAERVEALVTEKIEDKLLDIPEIMRIRSQSRAGSSFISVELRDEVVDPAPVWSSIRGKLEDSISDLPEGALRPEFDELEIAAYAWIGAIVWDGASEPPTGVIRRLARELKDDFFGVQGTKQVDIFGDPLEEILVEVDADRAAATGLSAATIAAQLRGNDVKSAAGLLRNADVELVVEFENEFNSAEDILNATLRSPLLAQDPNGSPAGGGTLRLSDVAGVKRSTRDPPAALAIIDGQPGIVVSVMLRPEYRIDQWTESSRSVVEEFCKRLPAGTRLQMIMEQDQYVSQRLQGLTRNLLLGVAAVAVVTFLFLGWRSSILVTATLPIASLMVLSGMRFLGIPIHQMSITGLIIALGLLIDNAIIATDEVELSLRRGLKPIEAVGDMVSRLFAPLLASTVTTALAFAPIALMEGPAGEFVGSIATTVMLAIFSSFLLAMTAIPASAALLLAAGRTSDSAHKDGTLDESRPSGKEGGTSGQHARRSFLDHGISIPPLTALYRRFLTFLLRVPVLGIMLGCILPIAGFIAATQLSEQFFPPADRDQFHIEVELSSQTAIEATIKLSREIDQILNEVPRVRHTTWFLGESAPPFYYNMIARRSNSPNYAQAIVTLDDARSSLELIQGLQQQLDDAFPQARVLVRQLEQGPPFDAPVEVRLFGPDLDQLRTYGEELRTLTTQVPHVLHTRTALSDFRPAASIAVNSHQANWVGLSDADVAAQMFARFEGLPAGSIIEEVERIPVRVRIAGSSRDRIEDVTDASLMVSSPPMPGDLPSNGLRSVVPVSTIAEVQLNPQRAVITRYNGRRINEVQSFIKAGTLPSDVLAEVHQKIEAAGLRERLPSGYTIEFGGEASERNAAVGRLLANVSVLAVGMVGALVLALASFRMAGLIGFVALLSIGLGLGALWIFGYPFGFMAIIGTMGLIGIAINDSIVVVAALAANPLVRAKADIEAMVETVVEVTRHVLATTATTVVGFMPLLLSGGGFWPPLAVAISVGVAGATLIALTLVPCVFRLIGPRLNTAIETA